MTQLFGTHLINHVFGGGRDIYTNNAMGGAPPLSVLSINMTALQSSSSATTSGSNAIALILRLCVPHHSIYLDLEGKFKASIAERHSIMFGCFINWHYIMALLITSTLQGLFLAIC